MNIVMLLSKSFRTDHRVYKEAASLQAAGHAVTVVEWARHHPEEPEEDVVRDVPVRRVHDRRLARLLPSDHFRNPLWWRSAARVATTIGRLDVVHCHDLDTLPAGVRLKKRTGCRLVFDAHEVFAEMLTGNQPRVVVAAARALERRLLPHVDLVIAPTDRTVAHYRAATGGPVALVQNTFGDPPPRYSAPTETTFTLTYIGILSRDRLFPQVIDAVAALDDVRFVVAGKREGVWAEVEAHAARRPNVDFLGPLPFSEVLPKTRAGHAVLCMLDPRNPQYRVTPATKLYDAMSTGRPIITTQGTYMGDFVTREDVGLAVAYDPASVQEAVARLRDDPEACRRMGKNGLRLARDEFQWPRQAERLVAAYADLGAGGP